MCTISTVFTTLLFWYITLSKLCCLGHIIKHKLIWEYVQYSVSIISDEVIKIQQELSESHYHVNWYYIAVHISIFPDKFTINHIVKAKWDHIHTKPDTCVNASVSLCFGPLSRLQRHFPPPKKKRSISKTASRMHCIVFSLAFHRKRKEKHTAITTMMDGFMQVLFSLLSTLVACLDLNIAIYILSLTEIVTLCLQ